MNAKMTSLLGGVVLLAGVGFANAAEPMLLTAASMDTVTAAGGGNYDHDHAQSGQNFHSSGATRGVGAGTTADAVCVGTNCLTYTNTVSHVNSHVAIAVGIAVAINRPDVSSSN